MDDRRQHAARLPHHLPGEWMPGLSRNGKRSSRRLLADGERKPVCRFVKVKRTAQAWGFPGAFSQQTPHASH